MLEAAFATEGSACIVVAAPASTAEPWPSISAISVAAVLNGPLIAPLAMLLPPSPIGRRRLDDISSAPCDTHWTKPGALAAGVGRGLGMVPKAPEGWRNGVSMLLSC